MINVFNLIAISQIVFKRVELAKYPYVHKTTMRVVVSKKKKQLTHILSSITSIQNI